MVALESSDERACAAVDSYLDPLTLSWLLEHGRLKSDDNPVGLVPGEAGVCMLLEHRSTQRPSIMQILGLGQARGPSWYEDEPAKLGAALGKAIEESLSGLKRSKIFEGDIISDHNGENWRAADLTYARHRLHPFLSNVPPPIFPALSLGDVGAASSAVGLAVAAHTFARNYANGPNTLVLSRTELGEAASFLVGE